MTTSTSQPVFASASSAAAGVPGQIRSYPELQQQIHNDLRIQHPEWVRPDGNCPTCESYERRLAELIGNFQSAERNLAVA